MFKESKDLCVIFLHCLYIGAHHDSFSDDAKEIIKAMAYEIYKECNFNEEEFCKIAEKFIDVVKVPFCD